MIDISHAQARRLIRLALDSVLPDEQWNALLAHTERCDTCRIYQSRWAGFERQLRRALHAQWDEAGSDLSPRKLSAAVLAMQAQRHARQYKTRKVVGIALGVLLLIGVVLNRQWVARQQALVPVTANLTAVPTATATPLVPPFQGVVAFEAPHSSGPVSGGGKTLPPTHDIYLMVSGPRGADITDLTDSLSHNTDPTWSPDGRWLAFISNRAHIDSGNMGNDIYMLTVAGTRLTRLTQSAHMIWQGPISWSADGQWIAAVGAQSWPYAGPNMLYLISVNGRQPPRLIASDASTPKFSPVNPWLAFLAPGDSGPELYVYDYTTSTQFSLTGNGSWPVVSPPGGGQLYIGQGAPSDAAFDWLDDGKTLTFITLRQERTVSGAVPALDLREANDLPLDFSTVGFVLYGRSDPTSLHLSSRATFNAPVREVTWSAFGDLLYVPQKGAVVTGAGAASTGGAASAACSQPLFAWQDATDPDPGLALPTLCLAGAVQRANWLRRSTLGDGGDWLVVPARRAEEAAPGIYALRIPRPTESSRAVGVLRLANLPAGAGPLEVQPEVK